MAERSARVARSGVEGRATIAALTGIRALAAFWVVLFHFRVELVALLPGLRPMLPFAAAGRVGVDLFFVLSGFILAYNYADRFRTVRRGAYGRFLWLRLARIYPVHLVTLGALVAVVAGMRAVGMPANPPGMYTAEAVVSNLLLVNAWPGMSLTWNYPAWSISAEWFAYLLFPFAALLLARVRSARAALVGAAAALAVMYGVFVAFPTGWPFPAPLVRIGAEFLAGMLLWAALRHGFGRRWGWSLIAAVTFAGIIAVGTALEAAGYNAIWVVPLLALLIVAVARGTGWLSRWLGSRHMVFFGQVSYALYMTHALCQLALTRVLPPDAYAGSGLLVRLGVVAAYTAVIMGVAVGVYKLVEIPSREWMRRRLAD